jgi:hypothetical protein
MKEIADKWRDKWTDMKIRMIRRGDLFFPNFMIILRWFVFICFLSDSVRSSSFWQSQCFLKYAQLHVFRYVACRLCLKWMSRGASCI